MHADHWRSYADLYDARGDQALREIMHNHIKNVVSEP